VSESGFPRCCAECGKDIGQIFNGLYMCLDCSNSMDLDADESQNYLPKYCASCGEVIVLFPGDGERQLCWGCYFEKKQAKSLIAKAKELDAKVEALEQIVFEKEFLMAFKDFIFDGLVRRFGSTKFSVEDFSKLLTGPCQFSGTHSVEMTASYLMVSYHLLVELVMEKKISIASGKPSNHEKPWLGGFLLRVKDAEPETNP
jgi:DNA-directed RNA polymerase subunit RPC12/RpoP